MQGQLRHYQNLPNVLLLLSRTIVLHPLVSKPYASNDNLGGHVVVDPDRVLNRLLMLPISGELLMKLLVPHGTSLAQTIE